MTPHTIEMTITIRITPGPESLTASGGPRWSDAKEALMLRGMEFVQSERSGCPGPWWNAEGDISCKFLTEEKS